MGGLTQYTDNDDVTLKGGTTGAVIGNEGDALKVTGTVTVSGIPAQTHIYEVETLRDGAAENANVNGTLASPRTFSAGPSGPGGLWYIGGLSLFLQDNGTTSAANFGAVAGLTNGVLVQVRSGGTTYDVTTVKNNMDLLLTFNKDRWLPITSGFLETSDVFQGTLAFPLTMKLNQSQGDFIRIQVRDNLTGLDQLRCRVHYWRQP